MSLGVAGALAASLSLTLVATPWLRRVALASGFVDQPADRKSHVKPIPYLGGVAIVIGTLVGLVFGGRLSPETGVIALSAAMLGTIGLLDDHKAVSAKARLTAEALAASAVLVMGVRAHVTGIAGVDIALTVVWIIGITNAVNFLDNMDGLAGGVSAAAGAAVLALALASGQDDVARLSAALTGASVGFLVFNRRPASIFMGDAGSLFLGFLLAVSVLQVNPMLVPPASFLVPLLLLALPVLDTTVVVLARLRHGRSVGQAGKDHLSHRLVARGFSPGAAVVGLVGAEVVLAVLAVLSGRALVSLPLVAAASALPIGLVAFAAIPAKVYAEDAVRSPMVLRWGTAVAGIAVVAFAIPTTLAEGAPERHEATPMGPAANQGSEALGKSPAPATNDSRQGWFSLAEVAAGLVLVNITLVILVRRRRAIASPSSALGRR
jgi:UDP-GlcNAc:undecaprenyl-phosphate GlcNAc-1-phosphate transferase